VVTDISLTYQLFKQMSLQIGANNLFNVYPDKHSHSANDSFGRFPYSRRATQFGFNGAFYFARLGFTL
jgi:iron complex outermembrane recepter protein